MKRAICEQGTTTRTPAIIIVIHPAPHIRGKINHDRLTWGAIQGTHSPQLLVERHIIGGCVELCGKGSIAGSW